jgi:hypothetical protein
MSDSRNGGEVVVSAAMSGIVNSLVWNNSRGLALVPAERCARMLGMTGVAVTVLASGVAGEVIWRTDGPSASLDDLQFTLGEGPAVDVAASGELILEPDLAAVPPQRWPAFTRAALDLGVRAIFAVPMQIGAIRLGVLLAHRDAPGPMGDGVLADTLAFADAATGALLGPGAGGPDAPPWLSDEPTGYTAQIHQATGMVSVQLGIAQVDALVRLRAYAFRERRALAEVAAAVVARQLRFNQDAN